MITIVAGFKLTTSGDECAQKCTIIPLETPTAHLPQSSRNLPRAISHGMIAAKHSKSMNIELLEAALKSL